MPLLWVAFALLLLAAAGVVFWVSRQQRRASGLPEGQVTYSDSGAWRQVPRPLYDPLSGLSGKPDYLVELKDGHTLIPVEVKSGRAPSVPHDSHVFQLAAYCRLVERVEGIRPPYGILHYRDRSFTIDYTEALESQLDEILRAMRQQEKRGEAQRSHQQPSRCARCGYRKICEQRL